MLAIDFIRDEPDPFHWRMGVRPLELDKWLVRDARFEADLAELRLQLAERRAEIIYCEKGSEIACAEIYATIRAHCSISGAETFVPVGAGIIEAARLVVQEDLCVMTRKNGFWAMTACAVAFPTSWDVQSKFGRGLDEIHEPVPRYSKDLAKSMNVFFDRLRAEAPVWRSNRTLSDRSSLRLEPSTRAQEAQTEITIDNVGDRVFLRVEYQTLRKFPISDSVLFTIRILQQPLRELLDEPVALRSLVRGLAQMPSDIAHYKRGTSNYEQLIAEWVKESGLEIS
jgi:hypothetical protein